MKRNFDGVRLSIVQSLCGYNNWVGLQKQLQLGLLYSMYLVDFCVLPVCLCSISAAMCIDSYNDLSELVILIPASKLASIYLCFFSMCLRRLDYSYGTG